jgi:hypothetical protein
MSLPPNAPKKIGKKCRFAAQERKRVRVRNPYSLRVSAPAALVPSLVPTQPLLAPLASLSPVVICAVKLSPVTLRACA